MATDWLSSTLASSPMRVMIPNRSLAVEKRPEDDDVAKNLPARSKGTENYPAPKVAPPVRASPRQPRVSQEFSSIQGPVTAASADTAWFSRPERALNDVTSVSSRDPTLVESNKAKSSCQEQTEQELPVQKELHSEIQADSEEDQRHLYNDNDHDPKPVSLAVIQDQMGTKSGQPQSAHCSVLSWSVSEVGGTQYHEEGTHTPRPIRNVSTFAPEVEDVLTWLIHIDNEPSAVFNFEGPEGVDINQCDIEPDSVKLMPKIDYPDCYKRMVPGQCRDHRDISWRHANMTSELAILREIQVRENLKARVQAEGPQAEEQILEEPTWPNAKCVLRPVTERDFDEIASIINMEAVNGSQAFGAKTSAAQVRKIYGYCKSNLRPFIVAVPREEDFTDRSKWPQNGDKAYREFVKFKQSQPFTPTSIVGFAFVSEARVGFLNSPCSGSQHTGQIRLVVHPRHRREQFGTALLDRILQCVAPFYKSVIDYAWECEQPEQIYEFPTARNERKYSRVYLEIVCASKKHAEYRWRAKMLEKFEFKKAAFLREAMKTDSQLLHLAIWELKIQHLHKSSIVLVGPSLTRTDAFVELYNWLMQRSGF